MTAGEEEAGDGNGFCIDLKGTLSVVIGASEGIGAAVAAGLSRAGSRLVVCGRDERRMTATIAEIRGHGGSVACESVDVRSPDSIRSFAEAVIGRHGTPTVLVNSMGGTLIKEMRSVEAGEWDDLHNTHLRGTFLTCRAFADAMANEGYGKIINFSSLAAFRGNPLRGVYSVAKAGLNHLTTVLAAEWGPHGIRVNGIAPATTRTPRAVKQFGKEPEREANIIRRTPLGRIATPADMVGPALFLASRLSDFVSGQTLVVDGGAMAVR